MKLKDVVFHNGNDISHTFLQSRLKLLQLEWDVTLSTVFARRACSSDFHLFWTLRNPLKGRDFDNEKTTK